MMATALIALYSTAVSLVLIVASAVGAFGFAGICIAALVIPAAVHEWQTRRHRRIGA